MFLTERKNSGFTLVEMLVSVSIIVVIMSVVLFNYNSFTDNLALSAAAQELAITIRQAQTYGLSVKEVVPTLGNFSAAYGVYVNETAGNNTGYTLFADTVSNKVYDAPAELIQNNTFKNGITVSEISSTINSVVGNPTSLDISFLRPSPDARIFSPGALGNATIGVITLKSPRGKTITVTAQSTGQVFVGRPN